MSVLLAPSLASRAEAAPAMGMTPLRMALRQASTLQITQPILQEAAPRREQTLTPVASS